MASASSFDLQAWGEPVLRALAEHLRRARAGEDPVLAWRPAQAVLEDLDVDGAIRRGGLDPDAWGERVARIAAHTTRLHHPGFLGHQVAAPTAPSALAGLADLLLNNGMAVYDMGMAPTVVERAVVHWMLARVGWRPDDLPYGREPDGPGPHADGVLTHGGSLANLTCLLAARAAIAPGSWTDGVPGDLVVLVPPEPHYSIARAVAILGLGTGALATLPSRGGGRVDPDGVEPALDAARAQGRRVMAVVANACATATGAYDALDAIGAVCRRHGVWLHVDGAHGASALLAPAERARLAGVELADSLVWDAHKMLQTPVLCAAALVRDGRRLLAAFRQQGSYLFAEQPREDGGGPDLAARTFECTKSGLALRLFANLATLGEAELGASVARRCATARAFAARIAARPAFTVLGAPESNIVCFRHEGDDALQTRLRERVIATGRNYITKADVDGRRWLRIVVMNEESDEATLDALLDDLEGWAREG